MQTKRIAFSAIFCALIFVATAFIKVPVAIGYFNLGDAFLLISAVCCGPFGGAIGGMIGCALADVIGGYAVYAPFTLVVKGVEGLICGLLFLMIKRNEKGYFFTYLCRVYRIAFVDGCRLFYHQLDFVRHRRGSFGRFAVRFSASGHVAGSRKSDFYGSCEYSVRRPYV